MGINDTIAAVSTPRGKGGIAVIRISGGRSAEIADKVFLTAGGKSVSDYPARRALYGSIHRPDGEELDRGILTFFKAPASYTGEDMAEISCHGGVYVTRAVLGAVFEAGAVPAAAGEFTRRAFLSGKMTLTEAEAVGTLLDADTEEKMLLASSAVRGKLSEKLSEITDMLRGAMSALYALIDYPEEELNTDGEISLEEAMDNTLSEIRALLSTYKRGKAVADGVKCVICGSPNAGKSSLYNLMSGEQSAIVTDIAGTTRDILKERVSFGGVTLELFDTAGLRETDDVVESIGVRRAEEAMSAAELIIAVFDSSSPLTEEEKKMIDSYPQCAKIAVLNKQDLDGEMSGEDLALIEKSHDITVKMSCINTDVNSHNTSIDELACAVGRLYDEGACVLGQDAVIWEARHEASLRRAEEYLSEARAAALFGGPADAVCSLCESALSELCGTDGRGVTEDIVSEIFSKFCVGK